MTYRFTKRLLLSLICLCLLFGNSMTSFGATNQVDQRMGHWYTNTRNKGGGSALSTPNVPLPPSGTIAKGIDISKYDGTIDFSKLKNDVDFVIVRCGYGQDLTNQDDPYFERNIKGCRDNGIPYGIYLYSYATSQEMGIGEGNHALRLLRKCQEWGSQPSYPIFLDMEDDTQAACANATKTAIAKAFANVLAEAGYTTGIYANRDWFIEYLTDPYFKTTINWLAQYNQTPTWTGNYAMWQCTAPEYAPKYVSGIAGPVDYDYMLKNIACKPDISKMSFTNLGSAYKYTGNPVEPDPIVKNGAHSLKKDVDYTITYTENVALGKASLLIKGIGNYGGQKTLYFDIKEEGTFDPESYSVNINNALISAPPAQIYNGKGLMPLPTITYNGRKLVNLQDYRLEYDNNINVGTASLTIYGMGDFHDSTTLSFRINPKPVATCSVGRLANVSYTGKPIYPGVAISNGYSALVRNRDYVITYGKNTSIGKATLLVTGKGNYTGSRSLNFVILPKKIGKAKLSRSGKKLKVSYKKVAGGASGYEISYRKVGSQKWKTTTTSKLSKIVSLAVKKKHQVRVRGYVVVNRVKYYGPYSTIVKSK